MGRPQGAGDRTAAELGLPVPRSLQADDDLGSPSSQPVPASSSGSGSDTGQGSSKLLPSPAGFPASYWFPGSPRALPAETPWLGRASVGGQTGRQLVLVLGGCLGAEQPEGPALLSQVPAGQVGALPTAPAQWENALRIQGLGSAEALLGQVSNASDAGTSPTHGEEGHLNRTPFQGQAARRLK